MTKLARAALAAGTGLAIIAAAAGSVLAASTPLGSVLAFDQKAAKEITVTYAFLPRDGYAVVYRGGTAIKPGTEIIGSTPLKSGDHRDVKIALSEPLKPGQRVWVKLHEDKDGDGAFKKGADPLKTSQVISPEQAFIVK